MKLPSIIGTAAAVLAATAPVGAATVDDRIPLRAGAIDIFISGEIAIAEVETNYYKAVLDAIGGGQTKLAGRMDGTPIRSQADVKAITWKLVTVMSGGGDPPMAMVRVGGPDGQLSFVPIGKALPDGRVFVEARGKQCGIVVRSAGGVEEAVYTDAADLACGGRNIVVRPPDVPKADVKKTGGATGADTGGALWSLPATVRAAIEGHPGCVLALKKLPAVPAEPSLALDPANLAAAVAEREAYIGQLKPLIDDCKARAALLMQVGTFPKPADKTLAEAMAPPDRAALGDSVYVEKLIAKRKIVEAAAAIARQKASLEAAGRESTGTGNGGQRVPVGPEADLPAPNPEFSRTVNRAAGLI